MAEKTKNSNTFRKYLTLVILCIGAGLIYKVAYLREVFYEPLRQALNVTTEEVGALSTMYGTIAMFTFIPGGIIADKMNAKKLLAFSFLSTAALTFWYATIPSYGTIKLIMALMAITTDLTFWSTFLKGVRSLGTDDEQSKIWGLSEGIRSAAGILGSFAVLGIMEKASSSIGGLRGTLIFYGIVYAFVGVFVIFFMPDTEGGSQSTSEFKISDVWKVLKSPGVWLVTLVIFGVYNLYVLQSYTTPYLQNVCLVPAVIVGGVGIIRQYGIGLLSGPAVGMVGDKVGSPTKTLGICTIIIAVCVAGFIVLPANTTIWLPVILTVVLGFMVYALRGVQYAVMPEAQIPLLITGTATGIISTVGYLPDIYIYTQVGRWLDTYSPEKVYNMIFMYMLFMAALVLVGVLGILFLSRRALKQKKTSEEK